MAFSQAQLGQEHEALASLDAAHTLLPNHPEDDPIFLFVDSGVTQMLTGWTYFELSQPHDSGKLPDKTYLERAWSAYTHITETSQRSVSDRVHVEAVNHQAKVALGQRDLEKFPHYFLEGVRGARALNSQKRKQEAKENWKAATQVWGHERRVLELAEELMDG
jgi:hypothetical protein